MSQPAKHRAKTMTKAEWEKIHNACVRAEAEPDPEQITALDVLQPDAPSAVVSLPGDEQP